MPLLERAGHGYNPFTHGQLGYTVKGTARTFSIHTVKRKKKMTGFRYMPIIQSKQVLGTVCIIADKSTMAYLK